MADAVIEALAWWSDAFNGLVKMADPPKALTFPSTAIVPIVGHKVRSPMADCASNVRGPPLVLQALVPGRRRGTIIING